MFQELNTAILGWRPSNTPVDDRRRRRPVCPHRAPHRADREWAYDRKSHGGQLDKALDEAQAKGWTVVNMKNDWKTIFPFGSK